LIPILLLLPQTARAEIRVSLITADAVAIEGTYYEPIRRPAPMVLLVHMATRSRADWSRIAPQFAQRGIGALAIDLRGHGDSGIGPPAAPDNDVMAGSDRFGAVRDIQAAVAWLKQRPDGLSGRVAIVGASLGANLAVVAAAEDPAVRALVLLSVTLDFRGVRTEAALKKFGDRAALLLAPGFEKCGCWRAPVMAPSCSRVSRICCRPWWTGCNRACYDPAFRGSRSVHAPVSAAGP
jgi:pimeloyl-ACP methyl ester carboxylesterase